MMSIDSPFWKQDVSMDVNSGNTDNYVSNTIHPGNKRFPIFYVLKFKCFEIIHSPIMIFTSLYKLKTRRFPDSMYILETTCFPDYT